MDRYSNLISIIVPVYNVEEYLIPCVDSILNQTYKTFEIILVDDGSTDRSGEICDELEKKDVRISVHHKPNGGLSDARNYGMKYANAEYITFIDSDDTISPYFLDVLMSKMIEKDADIVQCSHTSREENLDTGTGNEYSYNGEEGIKQFLLRKNVYVAAWGKLYKTELFKDIKFPYGRINEDVCTTYKVIYRAKKTVCLDHALYWHRMRQGSIMRSPFSEKNFEIVKTADEIREFLGKDAGQYVTEINFYEYKTVLILLNALLCSEEHNNFPEQKKSLRKKILSVDIDNHFLSVKDKILIRFLQISPYLYEQVLRKYRKLRPRKVK